MSPFNRKLSVKDCCLSLNPHVSVFFQCVSLTVSSCCMALTGVSTCAVHTVHSRQMVRSACTLCRVTVHTARR